MGSGCRPRARAFPGEIVTFHHALDVTLVPLLEPVGGFIGSKDILRFRFFVRGCEERAGYGRTRARRRRLDLRKLRREKPAGWTACKLPHVVHMVRGPFLCGVVPFVCITNECECERRNERAGNYAFSPGNRGCEIVRKGRATSARHASSSQARAAFAEEGRTASSRALANDSMAWRSRYCRRTEDCS